MKIKFLETLVGPLGILLLIFIQALPGEAAQTAPRPRQVEVLIGFDSSSIKPLWKDNSWRFALEAQTIVANRFQGLGFQIVVTDHATQVDLSRALNSSENIAVFWVGHSGIGAASDLVDSAIATDINGVNVAPLFKKINPNILWFGLIGCNGESLIRQARAHGAFKENPYLRIDSFDRKVSALDGLLSSATRAFIFFLALKDHWNFTDCTEGREIALPVTIRREISDQIDDTLTAKSVRIELNGHVVAVFPEGRRGEVQEISALLPRSDVVANSKIPIVIESGLGARSNGVPIILGTFQIVSMDKTLIWQGFRKTSGELVGSTKNLYQLQNREQSFPNNFVTAVKYSCP
jgi:hypothetical protein